jgi:hypothetical protein
LQIKTDPFRRGYTAIDLVSKVLAIDVFDNLLPFYSPNQSSPIMPEDVAHELENKIKEIPAYNNP